jgi:hypothetical protein
MQHGISCTRATDRAIEHAKTRILVHFCAFFDFPILTKKTLIPLWNQRFFVFLVRKKMVGRAGFEPAYSMRADLQTVMPCGDTPLEPDLLVVPDTG